MHLNEATVAVRLLLAVLCSGVLGLERTRKRRPAGLRTYMLVCIGTTVVMMTAQFMTEFFSFEKADPGRMPAQVVSGIGFLGAGTIMVTRYYRVKGLTTAAGLWAAACMGLAIGIGFYFGAILTCLVLLAVMTFADRFESSFTRRLRHAALDCVHHLPRPGGAQPFLSAARGGDGDLRRGDVQIRQQAGHRPVLSDEVPRRLYAPAGVRATQRSTVFVEEVDD